MLKPFNGFGDDGDLYEALPPELQGIVQDQIFGSREDLRQQAAEQLALVDMYEEAFENNPHPYRGFKLTPSEIYLNTEHGERFKPLITDAYKQFQKYDYFSQIEDDEKRHRAQLEDDIPRELRRMPRTYTDRERGKYGNPPALEKVPYPPYNPSYDEDEYEEARNREKFTYGDVAGPLLYNPSGFRNPYTFRSS